MTQQREYATLGKRKLSCAAMFSSTFLRASDKQSARSSVFTSLNRVKTLDLASLKFNKAESQILSLGILNL